MITPLLLLEAFSSDADEKKENIINKDTQRIISPWSYVSLSVHKPGL